MRALIILIALCVTAAVIALGGVTITTLITKYGEAERSVGTQQTIAAQAVAVNGDLTEDRRVLLNEVYQSQEMMRALGATNDETLVGPTGTVFLDSVQRGTKNNKLPSDQN